MAKRSGWGGRCILAAGLLVGAVSASSGQEVRAGSAVPAAMSAVPDFRATVQAAKDRVFPAVIYIRCIREMNEGGKREQAEVSGSGVILSADGDAITNWHVIDKASSVRVLLTDGRHFPAKVVGSDKDTDLALLRLELPEGTAALPYAELTPSAPLREGDFVMAMGAPWGLNRSVSIGIISCTTRYLEGISEYSLWLQTDAPINPGNSGGPLVNTDGRVIGLNARGMSGFAEGMGFAIPSDTIQILLPQLREHGRVNWSWLGLQLQPLRDFDRDMYFDATEGVIVSETDPESPARAAGLLARDRIVAVDGVPITALVREDLSLVQQRLGLLDRSRAARIDVVRETAEGVKQLSFDVTPRDKGKVEGEEIALERFDFTVKAINQFDTPDLFFHRKEGVFVYATRWPGNASTAGLRARDIVVRIGDQEIKSIDDVKAAHGKLVAGVGTEHRVVVTVLRGGLQRKVVLDFLRDFSKE